MPNDVVPIKKLICRDAVEAEDFIDRLVQVLHCSSHCLALLGWALAHNLHCFTMVSTWKVCTLCAIFGVASGRETLAVDDSSEMMEFAKNAKSWAESVIETNQGGPSMSSMLSSLSSQMTDHQ